MPLTTARNGALGWANLLSPDGRDVGRQDALAGFFSRLLGSGGQRGGTAALVLLVRFGGYRQKR